jgi:predicted nucleic acid-binding Zn ribbon protein
MCPYCGEDVPGESRQCWKCGSELSGDAAEILAGGQLEGSAQTCPSCQTPLPPGARGCGTCGWATREEPRRSPTSVHAAFLLVAFGVLIGLVFGIFRRGSETGRAAPIAYTYEQLAEIYTSEEGEAQALADMWTTHHHDRYVRWDMVILEISENGTLKLAPQGTSDPVVHLTLQDPSQIGARGLKAEKPIKYSAALKGYSGKTFFLTSGLLEDDA